MIAWYPWPFFNSSCPGRIDNSVSVSGHPKKIEGIKSRKVCVIAIEVINTIRKIESIENKMEVDNAIKKAPIRLICIPGMSPVIVPAKIPSIRNKIISINI